MWYFVLAALVGNLLKFLLDLYKQKSSRSSEQNSNLNLKNRKTNESWSLNQFPDLSQFTDYITYMNEGEVESP